MDRADFNERVEPVIAEGVLIAFDGCHKIYIALDEKEAEWFRVSDYGDVCDIDDPDTATDLLWEWWETSCPLRFVQAVANDGTFDSTFDKVIEQGED